MPKESIGDIELYYEVHGQGHPLVLIGGFATSHLKWQDLLEELTQHFQVIIFDNRGAGQTDAPDIPYNIDMMAEDTFNLIERLQLDKPHILGTSMGGAIAQVLGHKYPNRLGKLVIAFSFAKLSRPILLAFETILQIYQEGASFERLMYLFSPWIFSNDYLKDSAHLINFLANGKKDPHPITSSGLANQLEALKLFDSRRWCMEIPNDKLIISGERDLIILEKDARAFADLMENSNFYLMENTGHVGDIENKEKFLQVVLEFLNRP